MKSINSSSNYEGIQGQMGLYFSYYEIFCSILLVLIINYLYKIWSKKQSTRLNYIIQELNETPSGVQKPLSHYFNENTEKIIVIDENSQEVKQHEDVRMIDQNSSTLSSPRLQQSPECEKSSQDSCQSIKQKFSQKRKVSDSQATLRKSSFLQDHESDEMNQQQEIKKVSSTHSFSKKVYRKMTDAQANISPRKQSFLQEEESQQLTNQKEIKNDDSQSIKVSQIDLQKFNHYDSDRTSQDSNLSEDSSSDQNEDINSSNYEQEKSDDENNENQLILFQDEKKIQLMNDYKYLDTFQIQQYENSLIFNSALDDQEIQKFKSNQKINEQYEKKLIQEKIEFDILQKGTKVSDEASLEVKIFKDDDYVIKTEKHTLTSKYKNSPDMIIELSQYNKENKDINQDVFINKGVYLKNDYDQSNQSIKMVIKDLQNQHHTQQNLSLSSHSRNELTDSKHNSDQTEYAHFQKDVFETGRFKKMFENLDIIGQGGFGQVYKAKHKIEKINYAIKRIFISLKNNECIQDHKYLREVNAMTKLNHKNVIRHYTTWMEEPDIEFKTYFKEQAKNLLSQSPSRRKQNFDAQSSHFGNSNFEINKYQSKSYQDSFYIKSGSQNYNEDSKFLMYESIVQEFKKKEGFPYILNIQMHYCSSSTLQDFLSNPQRKSIINQQNFILFSQMLSGIQYIHDCHIIHRDIKYFQFILTIYLFMQILNSFILERIWLMFYSQILNSKIYLYQNHFYNNQIMLIKIYVFQYNTQNNYYSSSRSHMIDVNKYTNRPSNIFIDQDNTIIIGDFGLSTHFQENCTDDLINCKQIDEQNLLMLEFNDKPTSIGTTQCNQQLTQNIGTPLYLAPEQEASYKQSYDKKVDVYALGLILLELFCIIQTAHEKNQVLLELKKQHKIPETITDKYPYISELISNMTIHDPELRPNVSDIVKSKPYKQWQHEIATNQFNQQSM